MVALRRPDHVVHSDLWLGLLALAFFVIHAISQNVAGTPSNLIWACHIAAICVGAGILARTPSLCASGVLLLLIGLPLWLINLVYGGAFYPTSVLTHVGGLLIGLIALRRTGMPREAWLIAVGIIGILILAARIFTSPSANINLAFEPWHWSNRWFLLPEIYLLALLATWAAALWVTQQGYSFLTNCLAVRRGSESFRETAWRR